MERDQQHRGGWQQQHVQAIKTRKSNHAHVARAAQQTGEVMSQDRSLCRDLRSNHGSPIGSVVPGQKISRQPVGQREQQQKNTRNPSGLSRFLVSAIKKDLDHVHHHHHDHHAGAPVVEAANQPAGGQLSEDIAQTVVGIARSRRIVECQQRAREGLHQEQK